MASIEEKNQVIETEAVNGWLMDCLVNILLPIHIKRRDGTSEAVLLDYEFWREKFKFLVRMQRSVNDWLVLSFGENKLEISSRTQVKGRDGIGKL